MTPRRGWFTALCLAIVCVSTSPVLPQWVNVPNPATPRTPDGKPDLMAPLPRTPDGKPDLSGIWRRQRGS